MIKLLLFGCTIFPVILFSQTAADTIIWSGKRLVWNDFKGNYDTAVYNRQHLAITLWKLQYQYKPEPSKSRILFIIYTWFDAKKSWVRKKSRQDINLLLHEQGHFDLAELFARKFRKQLSETNFTMSNYKDSISWIFKILLNKAYSQQVRYDKETFYGTDEERQQDWQTLIALELKKTELYQSKVVTAKLTK